jgi:hypothetical protein
VDAGILNKLLLYYYYYPRQYKVLMNQALAKLHDGIKIKSYRVVGGGHGIH